MSVDNRAERQVFRRARDRREGRGPERIFARFPSGILAKP
jgi:hypothetical protein